MRITLLCSDERHPIRVYLKTWIARHPSHEVELVGKREQAAGGDFLFLISCHELIKADIRGLYRYVLVVHASDLPADRGWSPHIWAILRGDSELTVTLLEAEDAVDSGRVWAKRKIRLIGNEVCSEINQLLFAAELDLMDWAIQNHEVVLPVIQDGQSASYLRRHVPEDSRIFPELTIAEQFDLLRVADSERYPAFFEFRGRKFKINIQPF